MEGFFSLPLIEIGLVLLYLLSSIKILAEYERGVIFRLGRLLSRAKGPGLILVFRPINRMQRVSLRTVTMDVPPQDVITRDNVTVSVNAVVYFRVMDPRLAVVEVENYLYATSQLAQTTLRSVLGEAELDELLSARDKLNARLQEILDKHTDQWGIKVSLVEIKAVDLPQGCGARCHVRPKPSAKSEPRSFTPKASIRPQRNWSAPQARLPQSRWRFSYAICKR
jgi:regulator of protease activity HflC (stomatin/prohibitin superfamily)